MDRILALFQRTPEKQVARLRKKVKEPHGEASVRMAAAQRLVEMGTFPAIRALLDRFLIATSPSSEDEVEKQQVHDWLVSLGEDAVEPVLDFLRTERLLYWPIRALREILPEDEFVEKINEVLRFHWENPPASSDPKTEIIKSIHGVHSEKLIETVKLFLDDEDDEVRLAAIGYLFELPEESAREEILRCYAEAEDRPRIRTQILDQLVEKQWTVRGFRPIFEETLSDQYTLTRDGRVKRVGA